MIEKKLDVINKLGLHARAAAKVVSVASRYDSRILVLHKSQTIDAKSIMGLLMLGAYTKASTTRLASIGAVLLFAVAAIVLHTNIRVVWRVLDIQADHKFF